jgi:hypothetical protein
MTCESKKYALREPLWEPADQTIVYFKVDGDVAEKRSEAVLYDSREEAEAARLKIEDNQYIEIETVENETEFRAREDTW